MIYYKLPEQLECHHKNWVQHRGENATLANTVRMCLPISNVFKNPNCHAEVLSAIELPKAPQQQKRLAAPISQKGKQKEVTSSIVYMDVNMGLY